MMEPQRSVSGGGRVGIFRSILVGYDGSKESRRALLVADALALALDGEVHVLQVIRIPAHSETSEELEVAQRAEGLTLSQGLADTWDPTRHKQQVGLHVVFGDDPAKAIADFVRDHGIDVVVVGGHGRDQSVHRGIGHSLESLLRRHSCPVLVV